MRRRAVHAGNRPGPERGSRKIIRTSEVGTSTRRGQANVQEEEDFNTPGRWIAVSDENSHRRGGRLRKRASWKSKRALWPKTSTAQALI